MNVIRAKSGTQRRVRCRDGCGALVAARYFESVRHVQEGLGPLTDGRDYTCGCRMGGFATIDSQPSCLRVVGHYEY